VTDVSDDLHPISHYSAGSAHGPVRMFVDDAGRLALVRDVDGVGWELPVTARPAVPTGREEVAVGAGDSTGGGYESTARRRTDRSAALAVVQDVWGSATDG
jgi:hypothetical protein